ncbi:MAG TPA: hypothetical protein VGM88_30205 [Kofleriaceae bacterium]|jgi:hypothetical protein
MKRRDILKAGAVGAAVVAMPACAPAAERGAAMPVPPADPAEAEQFLATLDRQLGFVEHARFAEQYAAQRGVSPTDAQSAAIAENDALIRRMLRTLCITQGFRDLSPDAQLHPDVQARMISHLDEVDGTVFDLTDRLDRMSGAEHAGVQQALRADKQLAMSLGEMIDDHAARAGMSSGRRRQLRTMMMQTAFRLKHTAPGAVIGEYTAKVERMREETADSARALAIAERLAGKQFWAQQHRLAIAQQPSGSPGSEDPPPRQAPPLAPMPVVIAPPEKHHTVMKVGGIMMGVGAIVLGVSGIAVAAGGDVALFGLTAGAVLIGIGLIVLIVGAIAGA